MNYFSSKGSSGDVDCSLDNAVDNFFLKVRNFKPNFRKKIRLSIFHENNFSCLKILQWTFAGEWKRNRYVWNQGNLNSFKISKSGTFTVKFL